MNSIRKFELCIVEAKALNIYRYKLSEILEDDGSECTYALQRQLDQILDLKLYEKTFVYTNRDDAKTVSIIMRVK